MLDAMRYHGDFMSAVKNKVAVLPSGSVESHGPQGYLGVDSLVARRIAEEVAGRIDGVLLPGVDYTWCPEMNRPYPGTISVPQQVMQAYFEAILDGVLAWPVAGVLCVCGHNGNVAPLTVAADVVGERHPDQFVVAINWWDTWDAAESARRLGFSENGGHGHGGPLEMSAAWAVNPDGVDPGKAEDVSVASITRHPRLRVLHQAGAYPAWRGYQGRVSEASREAGEALIAHAVEAIVNDLQRYKSSGA